MRDVQVSVTTLDPGLLTTTTLEISGDTTVTVLFNFFIQDKEDIYYILMAELSVFESCNPFQCHL